MITLTVGSTGPKKQQKTLTNVNDVNDVNETEGGGAQINSERDSNEIDDQKRII